MPVLDRAALGLAPPEASVTGVYLLRVPRGPADVTVVLQESAVTYAFVTGALPLLDARGIDCRVYAVASAELFDALPPERRAEIFPEEHARAAMGITGFTRATLDRWLLSGAGREASLHPYRRGHYLGSGRGEVVLAEAGLDGESQAAAVGRFADEAGPQGRAHDRLKARARPQDREAPCRKTDRGRASGRLPAMTRVPTFAVVGVPNAGKSTLINRLSGTRTAVVHETPGVTRDRKVIETDWAGHAVKLIDTGGFDTSDQTVLGGDIRSQVRAALAEADGALFVVDGRAGPLPGDHEIADVLRRAKIPTLLVANKVDDRRHEADLVAFYELGLGEPLAVSALHGTGSGDLLDELVALTAGLSLADDEEGGEEAIPEIAVAIVGRPNAGKSSLLNALAGEERAIVGEAAGTTRDAIDTTVSWHGRTYRFVDTAGMRKAAKVSGIEYYAYLRSLASLDRAEVAVVVVDATVGLGELDLQIAGESMRRGCATVLAVNKSDVAPPDLDEVAGIASRKLRQRPRALAVSALSGRGLEHLLQLVTDLQSRYTAHIPTGALNRALSVITEQRTMPGRGRRKLKLYYISQFQTAPPRFAVAVNDRDLVTREFGFYVENRLREALSYEGVPLIIDFKER